MAMRLTTAVAGNNGFRLYRKENKSQGWQVTMTVNHVQYTKCFSDNIYGSAELARAAAEKLALRDRAVHDELLALRRRLEVRKTSRSGIPGVARYEGDATHGPHWLAHWIDTKTQRRRSKRYYVTEHGEDASRSLAVGAREEAIAWDKKRFAELTEYIGREYEMFDKAADISQQEG
jgi:hypothetical protein